jgi:tellurite resistance protein TehA-like permease
VSIVPLRNWSQNILITPPLFAVTFGFAGLSGTWRVDGHQATATVADLLAVVSAALAVALAIPWIVQLVRRETDLFTELRDPVLGPSIPALPIAAMLVSSRLLAFAETLGRIMVALFASLTLLAGLSVAAAWIVTGLPLRAYHPGFYLPTAGAALLAAQGVTGLGWVGFAKALFFVGLASWLVLGVITSLPLARTPLGPPLRPVMAIQIAAPALAGNTYVVVFHRFDGYAVALAAVTAVMGVVQLALIPYYRQAALGPAIWVSSFSYATAATLALRWISHELPPAAVVFRTLALILASAVVAVLSVVTLRAIGRGQFLARRSAPVRHQGASELAALRLRR